MIAQITDVTPREYRPPPWSILDDKAHVSAANVLNKGDVVLVVDASGHEARGDIIIKIVHPASGTIGWVERCLVDL